jgi:hypothetical protein
MNSVGMDLFFLLLRFYGKILIHLMKNPDKCL